MASLNPRLGNGKTCLAFGEGHEPCEKPDFRVPLHLPCPGSLQGNCDKIEHIWHCFKCSERIEIIQDDDYFYCGCGELRRENFSFKCSSFEHGTKFTTFPTGELNKYLKPIRELNILVIGTSEVETPFWLNSIVNYIAFPEAVDSSLHPITPFSFHITDGNDVVQDVRFENQTNSEEVKADVFAMGNTLIRLIDMPRFTDIAEQENIDEQFNKTLTYLRVFKELHGVCILLKPDEHTLGAHFELCFKEFLRRFSFTILRNVVFCTTCVSKSAGTRVSLTEFLWENKLDIVLDKSRMYSMDNETFRFFCAKNEGVEFNERDENLFVRRWTASAEETKRLLKHFQKVKPHQIKETMSIIEAKNNVFNISKAIADVIENIEKNIQEINSQRDSWIKTNETIADSAKAYLFFKVKVIEIESVAHRQTVCVNVKCAKYDSRGTNKYSSICHESCSLGEIPSGITGKKKIAACSAMGYDRLYCTICGCFWDCHQQIKFIKNLVPKSTKGCDGNFKTSYIVDQAKVYVDQLVQEQQKIIKASVKIGHYLSKRALISYKNVMGQYIQLFMRNESYVAMLRGVRDLYFKEDAAYQDLLAKSKAKEMDSVEFGKVLIDLYTLPHNGAQLKMLIETAAKCDEDGSEACERFHDISKRVEKLEKCKS